jgi:hypothetical protein
MIDEPKITASPIEFAALLDQFAAEQRALALGEAKKQRVILRRTVSGGASIGAVAELTLEKVIDADADAAEVYDAVAPTLVAIDRLANKVELAQHYEAINGNCRLIEEGLRMMAEEQVKFRMENSTQTARRNARRSEENRVEVGYTATQQAKLASHRTSIKGLFEQIEASQKKAAECRRVVDGEDALDVLREQVIQRLDRLRGAVPADVAA